MNKLIAPLLAVLAVAGLALPSNATLTNADTRTSRTTKDGSVDLYTALITATANDTTASADSNTIYNLDGGIKAISAGVKASNQTGTSPTLTVQLIGSFDNSKWFVLQSKQGSTAGTTANIATGALDISTASTTNVETGLSTDQFGRLGYFPPYVKVRIVVGGSSTPGWTGVAYAVVHR